MYSLVNTIFCRLHYNTESSSLHSQQFIKRQQDRYMPLRTRNERIKRVKGRRQKFVALGGTYHKIEDPSPNPEGSQIEPFFPIVPSKSLSVCTRNFLDSISSITPRHCRTHKLKKFYCPYTHFEGFRIKWK